MLKGWGKYRFKDVVNFQPTVKLHKGEKYQFVGMEDLEPSNRFVVSKETKLFEGSSCTKFKHLDILFARITPCLQNRKIAQVKLGENQLGFGSTEFFVFRGKKGLIDQRFLFYFVTSHSFVESAINSMVGASGRQRADKEYINNLEILLPSLPIQTRIADILSAYDDLIENNQKRIAILGKMAEQLYKEWFVRMRFPGYQTTRFIKGVPEGWAPTKFSKFISLKRGYDLPDSNIEEGPYPVVASTSVKAYHKSYKVNPPCICTGRSGSLGTVQYINKKCWPLNTSLYVKDFKNNNPRFVYYLLKELHLETFNSGAGVPTLNRNHLNGLKINLPSIPLQVKFEEKVNPIFSQVGNLKNQNENLRQTRDLLLPRLISGKLSVEKAEKQMEAVA